MCEPVGFRPVGTLHQRASDAIVDLTKSDWLLTLAWAFLASAS